MPIYEFTCMDCQGDFEELCRVGSDIPKCPRCSSSNVRRKLSVFSARSNGSEGTKSIGPAAHSCGSCHGGSCGTCH